MLNVREKISADIHDDVLSGLSSIRISSDLINETPSQVAKEMAKKISDTTKETAQRLNVIIWSLDHENDDWASFISYIKTHAFNFFNEKELEFSLEERGDLNASISINGNLRKNIFFVFKDALEIIKDYNQGKKVSIVIELKNDKLYLSINYKGRAISKQELSKNNLIIMKKTHGRSRWSVEI